VENRGVVWSIGGQYDWRKYLTLPNILKEFNPNRVEKAGPQTWLRLTWLLSYLSPQLSFEMSSNRLICFGLLFLITFGHVTSQRTSLDVALKNVYRPLRLLGLAFTGRSGDDPQNVQRVQIAGVSPADNAIIDPDPNGSVFPFVWH